MSKEDLEFPVTCHFRVIAEDRVNMHFVIETIVMELGITDPVQEANTSIKQIYRCWKGKAGGTGCRWTGSSDQQSCRWVAPELSRQTANTEASDIQAEPGARADLRRRAGGIN